MRPVLRPGAPLLRRDAGHLQIGTTPGAAHVVRERPGMLGLLRLLDGVRDQESLRALAAADVPQLEVDPGELLDALHAAQVVLDAEAWGAQPAPELCAEGRHLAARGTDAPTVRARLDRRARTRVEVSYDDRTAQVAAHLDATLRESGVPSALTPLDEPALVVVATAGPCPREVFAVLAEAGIAHLPVSCEEDRVRVGPLVRPGRTPCVGCDDRQRASWDPAWPGLLAQLGRPLARPAVTAPHALSAVLERHAAVVVAEEVLGFCDEQPARSETAAVTIGPRVHDQTVHPVAFSAACGCEILADDEKHLAPAGTIDP